VIGVAVAVLLLAPVAAAAIVIGVRPKASGVIALLASVGSLIAAVVAAAIVHDRGAQHVFGEWVYVDPLSVVIVVLVAAVGVCGVLNSLSYMTTELARGELQQKDEPRYYALMLVFLATMLTVPVVDNLGVMWVAIEATTVVSVLLVSTHHSGPSLEAAWKYLVLGSVGIALALFGTMMTYYASGSFGAEAGLTWTHLRDVATQLDPDVMRLAFAFILVGYGTKVGLAPMHSWLPDAHSQAPSPISGLLSGVLLNCAVYAVLRFRILADASAGSHYTDELLIGFGLFSVVLAVPFLVVQHDLKRLLGYHSVEHMGIIILAFGIGGTVAIYAALLHLVAHSLTKSSLFFSAGAIVQGLHTRSMHRMRGLFQVTPLAGAGLVIGALALAGLPPFAMFTSEYGLIAGGFDQGRGLIAIIGVLFIALAAASLLYHTIGVAYRSPSPRAAKQPLSLSAFLSVALPLALLLWLSVGPPPQFRDALNEAVAVLAPR
jgi:hydrogenase-4 component F